MVRTVAEALLNFCEALSKRAPKISATDQAYKIGVYEIPKLLKDLLAKNSPSKHWAFEGSVGKGSWSRTPWIAIYDERVTSRASDGFFIATILSENFENAFLVLMNTSSKHFNFTPYKMKSEQLGDLEGFTKGRVPRGEISPSGRGTGSDFESSTLIWKKFILNSDEINEFEKYLYELTTYYRDLAKSLEEGLPKEKPFKHNSFITR